MNYDWTNAKAYSEQLGLTWMADWVPAIDERFGELALTQDQLDGVMREHANVVKHLFTPHVYTWKGRLALAFYFLFRNTL